ncbi:hypothetical protein C8024_14110 [Sphingopyxis sp. BSNA05]|nr:hypothetical protein [Sphingopyxis sp. BSNA05]
MVQQPGASQRPTPIHGQQASTNTRSGRQYMTLALLQKTLFKGTPHKVARAVQRPVMPVKHRLLPIRRHQMTRPDRIVTHQIPARDKPDIQLLSKVTQSQVERRDAGNLIARSKRIQFLKARVITGTPQVPIEYRQHPG